MGGALSETELVDVMAAAGLTEVRLVATFDCFAGTSSESRLAADVRPRGANLSARKP